MKRITWHFALCGALLSNSAPTIAAAAAAFIMETAPPAGFEELTEPTPLVVDVYYGGRLIDRNQRALVSPTTLKFEQPTALLDKLPKTIAREKLLGRLSQTLPTNSHLVCRSNQRVRCGVVEAAVLDVIYDADRFRVDIFIGADYLPTRQVLDDPYLPPASNQFALSQRLSGSWSGSRSEPESDSRDSQSASLFGESILSFGESSLQGRWSVSDTSEPATQITDLYWTRDYRGKAFSVGLLQPRGSNSRFINSGPLYGVEYYQSNNTRVDGDLRTGTPLEVYLPVRGRVEVYRDDRLIHSQLIEAGNQLVSTRSFPQGAYQVKVKAFAEDGRPLEEFEQFFAKDSLLPAPGEWQWNLMLGTPAERVDNSSSIPDAQSNYLLQAGLGRRLLDNLGLFASTTLGEGSQALELGGRWITPNIDISPSLIGTSDGRSGRRLTVSLKSSWATLLLQESYLDSVDEASVEDALLERGYHNRSAALNVPLGKGRLSARYSMRDAGQEINNSQLQLADIAVGNDPLRTIEYQYPFARAKSWNGDLRLSYNDSGDEQLFSLNVQFRYNDGPWNHGASLRTDSGVDEERREFAGFSSSWTDGDLWASDVQQQVYGETDGDALSLRSNTRVAGRRGYFASALNYLDRNNKTLSYVGSFSTTLATDGDHFTWGGEQSYGSGVLVGINGADEDQFEILINGQRRGYATGGEQTLISVPAFDTYEIAVRPLGQGFYDFQDNSETVTLYPGNIASTSYDVKSLVLVVGRITENGKPVTGARFKLAGQETVTDQFGLFQLEYYTAPQRLNFSYINWNHCQVPVVEQSSDRDWLNLGTIELSQAKCDRDEIARN
ncbi:Outer membrane usher protein FimD/PapC [Microbulbifer donghaiensis]|uniref:Outer membrane usher protein FimD/PapC n=1 Tax=Microbulbifer donghaiensis TaxID=494016 RepID=A0A1M5CM93_9GAMM|nr:TcfC E-set like domain-containing protein [Microbulbifer donghaiensis]SHF55707.1 Outer membrane usher protein FimD/PapC [Microbulbifer donghaiensis]